MMKYFKAVFLTFSLLAFFFLILLVTPGPFLLGGDLQLRKLSLDTALVSGGPQNVNITAFSTAAGIVVVDTGESAEEGRKVRKMIETAFPGEAFAYVINTHSHWDHVSGNPAFPEAAIVAHRKCRESIQKKGEERDPPVADMDVPMAEPDESAGESEGSLPPPPPPVGRMLLEGKQYDLTIPDITFADSMSLHCGDTTFILYYFGDTHTVSDILVVVPEAEMLLAGDLFFHNWLPVFSRWIHPDPGRWQAVRDILLAEESRIETVVPGHGPLMDREELEKQFNYRLVMWDSVEKLFKDGQSREAALQGLDIRKTFPDMADANIKDSRGRKVHDENIKAIFSLLERKDGE